MRWCVKTAAAGAERPADKPAVAGTDFSVVPKVIVTKKKIPLAVST
jgi:hypothetical protein